MFHFFLATGHHQHLYWQDGYPRLTCHARPATLDLPYLTCHGRWKAATGSLPKIENWFSMLFYVSEQQLRKTQCNEYLCDGHVAGYEVCYEKSHTVDITTDVIYPLKQTVFNYFICSTNKHLNKYWDNDTHFKFPQFDDILPVASSQ